MFIMPAHKKQKGKTYTYYHLFNTIRTPKGPRHQLVLPLGKLENVAQQHIKLLGRLIERELSGTIRLLPQAPEELEAEAERIAGLVLERRARTSTEGELIRVDAGAVQSSPARLLGPVYVSYEFWKKLSLEQILTECGLTEKQRRLACVEVISRLVAPASERRTSRWVQRTAIASLLGDALSYVNKDALYRVSDLLWRKREQIEGALCGSERRLFLGSPIRLQAGGGNGVGRGRFSEGQRDL